MIRMITLRRMRWARHAPRMEMRNAYKISVGKPERKILLQGWDFKGMGGECEM
jgi:hypothetical protein